MCKNVCFTVTAPAPTVTIFKNLPWFDCWELLPYFLMFWWSWTFFSPTCILIVFFLWDFQWFVSLAHLHFGNSGLQFTVCVDSLYYKDLRGLSFFSGGKKWKNQTRILSETHNTECLVNFSQEACFPFHWFTEWCSALGVALSPYSRNGSGQEVEGGVRRLCDA